MRGIFKIETLPGGVKELTYSFSTPDRPRPTSFEVGQSVNQIAVRLRALTGGVYALPIQLEYSRTLEPTLESREQYIQSLMSDVSTGDLAQGAKIHELKASVPALSETIVQSMIKLEHFHRVPIGNSYFRNPIFHNEDFFNTPHTFFARRK